MFVPRMLLKRLYTFSSLKNVAGGVKFSVKNRLSDARLTEIARIKINGRDLPLEKTWLSLPGGIRLLATQITNRAPLDFPRQVLASTAAAAGCR
jgi:hydroxymethylglutaryl-CoA reductase (NADPH)